MILVSKRIAVAAVIAASLAAPQMASAATGLKGAYYDTDGIYSLSAAAAAIAGKTPDATFTATETCYPACHAVTNDNVSLNAYLGGNATNISANSISNVNGHVMTLDGFITFAQSKTYDFWLRSDDGSSLTIGGYSLLSDGLHALSSEMGSQFFAAGTYAISIVQFENGGDTGLTVKMRYGNNDFAPLTDAILSQGPAVPEPATWAMMIGGFGLAGAAMRRRATPAVRFA